MWTDADLQRVLQLPHYRVIGEASRPQQAGYVPYKPKDLLGVGEHAVPLSQNPYAPYRSRTEQRYAALLDVWQHDGKIKQWYYEPMQLRLAPRTTLTVDFLVVYPEGDSWLHEVKAAWYREDGWIKLKVAARLYPSFPFILAQYKKGTWTWKLVPSQ